MGSVPSAPARVGRARLGGSARTDAELARWRAEPRAWPCSDGASDPRASRASRRDRARCRAGVRSPRRSRPGLAGHDRALTVPGHVARTTRGPWVADTPPGGPPPEGVSLWGFHLRRAWGSSQEESPEGNPLTGESATAPVCAAVLIAGGWGRSGRAKGPAQGVADGRLVRGLFAEGWGGVAYRGCGGRFSGGSGPGAPTEATKPRRREAGRPNPGTGRHFAPHARARPGRPRSPAQASTRVRNQETGNLAGRNFGA